ncbi:hypothetical protein N9L09_01895 [Flavobacteriaceae bacterium]|nr:hypothetical protein [Flavobacteriaceae bacterium]
MPFKKKVISIDNEGLSRAEAIAQDKISLLEKAISEATKHITVSDLKAFSKDFMSYTTKCIVNKNKSLKDLKLSNEKVLNLLDIDLNPLYEIQVQFEENTTPLHFDENGKPYTRVEKEPFIQYTKNEEENKRLEAFQYLIVSLEEIEKYTHVYKGEVARLTSNAVAYDLRLNKWRINPTYFRK